MKAWSMKIAGQKIETTPSYGTYPCSPASVDAAARFCMDVFPASMKRQKRLVALDPLCGNGTIPAKLRSSFSDTFRKVFASDTNPAALSCARINLEKFSGPDAAEHTIFEHNALLPFHPIIEDRSVDLVLTDPPYGWGCHWTDKENRMDISGKRDEEYMAQFFANLYSIVTRNAVVGIMGGKTMKFADKIGSFRRQAVCDLGEKKFTSYRNLHVFKRM